MRRFLIAVLVLGLLSVSSAALAGQYKAFDVNTGALISSYATSDPKELARVFALETTGKSGNCNKFDWTTDITTRATVAQWIKWSVVATEWDWQVRKPGVFASDGNQILVSSNDDVNIRFKNFTDLKSQTHVGSPDIDAAYGWDPGQFAGVGDTMPAGFAPVSGWKEAPFADEGFQVLYSEIVAAEEAGKPGYPVRFWNKIAITDFTRACNYLGTGQVVISVTDQKDFIDGSTGEFKPKALAL